MTRSLLVCVLAVAMAACSAATDVPPPVDGRYVLQTVNSAALPFAEGRDQMGGLVSLVADTLWLRIDGTYTDAAHVANTYDIGTAMTVTVSAVPTSYVLATWAASVYVPSIRNHSVSATSDTRPPI